jgi:hypothetical protein
VSTPLKAYVVRPKWDDEEMAGGVYIARSRGAAVSAYLPLLRDVVFDARFTDIRAVRAPEYDRVDPLRSGVRPECADRMLAQKRAVAAWNAAHAPGAPVRVRMDSGEVRETVTRSSAALVSEHAVVWLEGIVGCYALSHVTPLLPAEVTA